MKDIKIGMKIVDVDGDIGIVDKIEYDMNLPKDNPYFTEYYINYENGRYGWITSDDILEVINE